ncbi:hypothetical protein CO058_01595 [candidate division WWE3 bacterium CG_4_9_14_0_2_um_filter_35_11]|uniref:DNA 3'-5' helicase n=1 Tax=candidate division WWE3 bacterium CG_4_9_14_0_2_um_filter_35_11 TaxID=1975077 RepID=A0A2M8EM14_UNCKA|nr:MAG: hypothetical protein COV25_04115 [candidate division WWE3 bacterium CG10_big_fil_rev_8_21_14_0_10_35_32]PJC23786.1 MAG: hypothetical protein CO058_01595 [candidate division WWE3 bacterium CG_4_9_14_0_2_um_filter_35_11]
MKDAKSFDLLYKGLNVDQKLAVSSIEGPVMLIAGPGTGKTQTLTMRIANILLKTDATPDSILALTFTESGVRAMRERLLSIIGNTSYYVNIHTFHSFASEVIQSNPDEFIIATEIEPLSDLERIHIFKEIFDKLDLKILKPFNSKYYYLRTAISKIQNLKREGIDINEYKKYISESDEMPEKDKEKNVELSKIYELYESKLKSYGRYDFEDMINFVIEKFKTSPALLQKYQERFQYFLVDEFQDTNSAQAELLYQLSSYWDPNPNLFVVGDDDQSIYRFQGASIENIINFNNKYPDAIKISLAENYRSVQKILDSAEKVISKNKLRISTLLKISKDQKSNVKKEKKENCISFGEFSTSYTENHFIAQEIKKLLEKGEKPNEIAVIYRNNADSEDIADMLSRMGIEYTLEGGENVLESGIIVRLLHLLRVIYKIRIKDEDLDLFTLLNYEFLDIKGLDILKLSRFASARKLNLFEAISHSEIAESKLSDLKSLKTLVEKITLWNELSANTTFIKFLEKVMDESGFLNWILNKENSYELLNKLNSFLSEAKRLNYSKKNLSLELFLDYVELMVDNGLGISEKTVDVETKSVKLTTAHKSKGLEFKYVFIPKFIDKKWGNAINRDLIKLPASILKTVDLSNDKAIKSQLEEDERRLFFVVLTRAKEKITITSAKSNQTAKYQKSAIPSLFLYEIPDDEIKQIDIQNHEESASEILKQILSPHKAEEVTVEEKDFLKDSLKNFKLSASSLNSYIACPYKFKLEYLFRTPQQKIRALILGSAVHSALEKANKDIKLKKPVLVEKVLSDFSEALKLEILNDSEFSEIEKEGHSILKIYHEAYKEEFYAESENNLLHVEKFFGWGFSRPLLDNKIHLQGKVDKIELLDKTSREIKIVDYKTGKPKSRNEILGNTQNSDAAQYRQLLFYKLLIDLDTTLNFKVREVELDYIGHRSAAPKRENFTITEKDVESLKETIRKVTEDIKNLKFEKTTDTSVCAMCKFKFHCWPDGIPAPTNVQLNIGL